MCAGSALAEHPPHNSHGRHQEEDVGHENGQRKCLRQGRTDGAEAPRNRRTEGQGMQFKSI